MEIEELLNLNGFYLHRNNKHRVYKNAKGITYVMSNTPSDRYAENQQVREFYKVMHKNNQVVLEEKPRKEVPMDTFNPPKMIIEAPKQPPKIWLEPEGQEIFKAGLAQRKTHKEIAQTLTALGYTTRTGKAITEGDISNKIFNDKNKVKKEVAPKSSFINDVTEIISSNLSDEMKERMIRQLV